MSETAPPYRLEPGYRFPEQTVAVSEAEQAKMLGYSGIDPAHYGAAADPSFLARPPITLNTAAILANHSDRAPVHVVQRIEQTRRVALGETLRIAGTITAIVEHPRGWKIVSEWDYVDRDGALVLRVVPDVLMIDRSRASAPRASRAPAAEQNGFETVARIQCTPRGTRGYCSDSKNAIHFDPETARKFGFRAPIIAGNQSINMLMRAATADGLPERIALEARLIRPAFWDDDLRLELRRDDAGRPTAVRVLNPDGKPVADGVVTVN